MLAIRGIQTSYESVCRWCMKFPQEYKKTFRKRQGKLGDIWYLDEVFLPIGGKRQYLWRAVDQDGDVIDILVQSRRNKGAAQRFFKKIFKGQASTPLKIVTDKLRSYQAALGELAPSLPHITGQYENNRAGNRKGRCADLNHPAGTTISLLSRTRKQFVSTAKTRAVCWKLSSARRPSFSDVGSGYLRLLIGYGIILGFEWIVFY